MEELLHDDSNLVDLAKIFQHHSNFLYLGRGVNYPIALEGALKLKEISYIHAEGYPAGEMKHGPIALIDEEMPVVAVVPHDGVGGQGPLRQSGLCYYGSSNPRAALASSDDHSAAAPGLSHRTAARVRRGPAPQPGQERHGRVEPGTRRSPLVARDAVRVE